jgi:hypothetical protein
LRYYLSKVALEITTMKKTVLNLILIFSSIYSYSQHLGAYTDYNSHFYIFDHGKSIQAEDLKIQSFSIGGECVLYVNNQGHLKLYYNGSVVKLESGGITDYVATDHIAAYTVFDQLNVIRNGQSYTLTSRCPLYSIQDSLIVFYDKNTEALRVYSDEQILDIESGLVGMPFNYLKSGDNIIAYISSRTKNFKIYYKGENKTILQNVSGLSFDAGRDIVAYVNSIDNTFHAYYRGQDYQIENFPPKWFEAGDEFVAYVDNMGFLKAFYQGNLIEISSYPPDGRVIEDNMMLFTEDEYMKVFNKGKVYEVEGFIPVNFKLDWNTITYLDNTNRIWLFSNGEKKFLTNDLVNSFEVYRDLIIINVKINRNIIYYQGSFYEGVSY